MSAAVLRRMVPYLRNPYLCNWDHAVAHALADWLERTASDFTEHVKPDTPECPRCGVGCAGHPKANFCDRCGNPVESDDYPEDPCRCWTQALTTAHALAVSFNLAPEQLALPVGGDPDGAVTAAWHVLAARGLVGFKWSGLMPDGWISADLLRIVAAGPKPPAPPAEPPRPWCNGIRIGTTARCGASNRHAPHDEGEQPAWFDHD